MKKMILLFCAFVTITSCYYRSVRGNGNVQTQSRNIGQFSGVSLLGSMNIILQKGDKNEVELSAEENILPYVETYVENDRLIVKFRDNVNVTTHEDVVVKVTTPRIREIVLTGSGDIQSESKFVSDDRVKIDQTGSGNVKLDLSAPAVEVSIKGSGDVDLQGETREAKFESMGSGNINAGALKSESTDAHILGSGDIHVFASIKLNANIMGSGNVTYKGGGAVTQHVMGSGEVSKDEE